MMTTKKNQRIRPSLPGTPSSGTTLKEKRVSRRCRGYHQRTLSYVRSSLDRWSYVFDLPKVDFSPEFQSCNELARLVKKLLASCPVSDPAQVMAYQSIKKGLPDSCVCMEPSMLAGLVENVVNGSPPSLPRGYLEFVKKTVNQLFPKGWDTDYEGFCRRAAPPLTGTLATPRSNGGSLRELSGWTEPSGEIRVGSQHEYLDVVLGKDTGCLGHPEAALQVVQSAGKPRPLTSFSSKSFYLKPLHKTIYKRLSGMKWLCRGDVTDDKLRTAGFSRKLGGVLTSGDYASATDNLSIEVYETCLSVMLKNSCCVPPNIIEYALRACRPTLYPDLGDYRSSLVISAIEGKWRPVEPLPPIQKGQMMGSLLSFPLLCLQNYLAFRFATRKFRGRIPVIINGDDILFQSPIELSRQWAEVVCRIGLQVEPTKTSVEKNWGTLNSTLFAFRGDELALVPTLRFGMLRPAEFPHSLGTNFHEFVRGQVDRVRWRSAQIFFEAHLGALKNCSFDLPSLGFRGALAHSLARKLGLLGGRQSGDLPPAPEKHTVSLPCDLICEVPNEFVDPVVQDLNSTETAAWKWSAGYSSAARCRSAILYCLNMTKFSNDVDVVSDLVRALSASDREFAFLWGGDRAQLTVGAPSRKELSRPFFEEKEPRGTTRIFWRISEEILRRAEWFWGRLPTYEEACARMVAVVLPQGEA
nr:MAG: RNA-dependent RNA polymerase [Botourmiaviridae sp.]